MFEQQTPHRLVKHEYLTDSAGPGQWRGGLGVETRFVIGSEDTTVVTFGDGDVEPAFGLAGGGPGSLNKIELVSPEGETRRLTSKDLVRGVSRGTLYVQHAGGGGGYGDPRKRPRKKVRTELRDGLISPQVAREDYGLQEED
jgi:N-methylhydantoinase B